LEGFEDDVFGDSPVNDILFSVIKPDIKEISFIIVGDIHLIHCDQGIRNDS